ncbi:MAG: IclR family transcriptional regulator [Desulfobacteraceae bacterium]|nr:IclR family transcriptional regulator [Desulfobacteraceae bacterium]
MEGSLLLFKRKSALQKPNNHATYIVPALKKGLEIVEMFSARNRVLTIDDFAKNLGVSVSSIYRTVVTLTEMHYLKKVGKKSYELGPKVLFNGFSYLHQRDIVQVAAAHLHALRDETSASCHLAIREGLETIYLYRAQSHQIMSVNIPVGTRFPCHTVAMGRAILTGLKDEALSRLYSGIPLDGISSSVKPLSLPQLRMMVARDKEQGYSINRSDFSTAIATPVVNFAGHVKAAINVSVPDFVINNRDVQDRLTASLVRTAGQISVEMGAMEE